MTLKNQTRSIRPRRQRAAHICLAMIVLGLATVASAVPLEAAAATSLPAGFSQDVVVGGLVQPTAFIWLPDGRLLVAEKQGKVRVVKDGNLLAAPLIDISGHVNSYWDHGLLGMAADPSFAANGHLYLLYVYENDPSSSTGPKTERLTRVTISGDTALAGSEVTLLGTLSGNGCAGNAVASDCIPDDSPTHAVGNLKFGADGSLWLTAGDGASAATVDPRALRTQDLDSLNGKVLHVSPTGQGLASNPFWTGDASANRSKVWSYGLRNPFRFNLSPAGLPVLGDVGWGTREEIDVASRGANLGWPCYEGTLKTTGYSELAGCQALYAQGPAAVQPPVFDYGHCDPACGSTAVTMGTFCRCLAWRSTYQNLYFFGDYGQGFLRYFSLDAGDNLIGPVHQFATGLDGPVDIEEGPDGNLYYLAINASQLRRIRYLDPAAVASATPSSGGIPLDVGFSSAGSQDPGGDTLTYGWDFGDGSPRSTEANPRHTYSGSPRAYDAKLTVTNSAAKTGTATVTVRVGVPAVSMDAPASSLRYYVGEVISFSGSARDWNGNPIVGSGLSWTITVQHCPHGSCHTHYLITTTGSTGTFTVPDHGDDSYLTMALTATDGAGVSSTTSRNLQPQTVQLNLATTPAGYTVTYDGSAFPAPTTVASVAGSLHTLGALAPSGGLAFTGWSDGGAQQHDISLNRQDASFTAAFGTPGVPERIAASPGDGQATVSWVAPSNQGASEVTGYTITGSPSGAASAGPGDSSVVVTGLQDGASYTFTVTANSARGSSFPSTASNAVTPAAAPPPQPDANVFYFAEGFTGPGFGETLALLMPSASGTARLDYYTAGGHSTGVVPLAAGRVTLIDVGTAVGVSQQVSVKVTLTGPGVVQRLIHFSNGRWQGSTDQVGAAHPSSEWDFAEGSTLASFSEYLTLFNPNPGSVAVDLDYFTDSGAHPVKSLVLQPLSRTTAEVFSGSVAASPNCVPSGPTANCGVGPGIGGVSVKVISHGGEIVVERPFYVNGFSFGSGTIRDGHVAFGANAAGTSWNFAEGTTLSGFNEYVTVQNPNPVSAHVTLRYLTDMARVITRTLTVGALSRATVEVFGTAEGVGEGVGGLALQLTSDQPVVAERPIYSVHDFGSGPVAGATVAVGSARMSNRFGFASASTAAGEYDYLTLQNPNPADAAVTLTYYTSAGPPRGRTLTVAANSRRTIALLDPEVGVGPGVVSLGVTVSSSLGILAEKVAYYSSGTGASGATDTAGLPAN